MKKVLLSLGAFLIGISSFAQQEDYPEVDEPCATVHSMEHRHAQNPSLKENYIETERRVQQFLKDNPDFLRNRDDLEITIPVVFHVLYHPDSPEQNIPDELIHSQIDVLNEDFAKLNDSTNDIREMFDSISVDTKIQFCLAPIDPEGNPIDGITRTETEADFGFTVLTQNAKYTDDGGKDAWPTDQYLNIWVCDMSFMGNPAVLGYAQFPEAEMEGNIATGSADTDGVVMQYQYVGRTESAETAPSNLGRVTTHEVGHWLGLRHIWGDGDCDSTDYVYDTPLMDGQSDFDCDHTKNTCDDSNIAGHWGAFDAPDMVENFMDYSEDACMAAFTRGQAERMWAFLMIDSRRNALFDSPASCSQDLTSVDDKENHAFKLYPNPARNFVQIESNKNNLNISVYDITGKLIHNENHSNRNYTQINTSNFDAGIYIFKISNDDMTTTKKVVVQ